MITVRRATLADARQMAALLNEIIALGGTTAMTNPVSRAEMDAHLRCHPDAAAWHVAEDEAGEILGFQWIAPHPALPDEAVDIATFAKVGRTGIGIGSALFRATEQAARDLGYRWINAAIRADNGGGLAYYQSRGFADYGKVTDVVLDDGTRVDKVLKRFDLD